jgi:hypothetical protein
MTWWSVVHNETGIELHVQSRLWFDARAAGALAMGQELGRYVGPEEVAVAEMAQGWEPVKHETSVGALKGLVGKELRP